MLGVKPFFIVAITMFSYCYTFINKSEPNLLIQLSNHLNVKNLIIIRKNNEKEIDYKLINFSKYLAKNFIFIENLTPQQARAIMLKYFNLKPYQPRTLVLLQENFAFSTLFSYKFFSTEKYLSNYIWLTFDDDQNIINSMKREYIPYDCQFLAIKTINKTKFEITEIYHASINYKNIFTKFFGIWENGIGFEFNKDDFYQRRFDMNGTFMAIEDIYLVGF